ncbi:MAG: twin-arginine translocation signal domain-containing protein [Bacteroidales bacterium]|nr:twin-arginine translocation signal domain-containing protein [Bacteroidales bacterium]
MDQLNRRNFVKRAAISTLALGLANSATKLFASEMIKKTSNNKRSAVIPMPIQVVIDDVGWWSGTDGSKWQEPYRTGIDRNHVLADYKAIVELGKALGIRPQAAMVLGEWDKQNILRDVPHSTWMGKNWDNSKWLGPWLEEAADIINSNKDNFEITMHGLGHEWWTDGKFTRAEWANNDGVMRPKDDIERHLNAFAAIMRQNSLGELPKSFVPTAFRHGFGLTPGNDVSIAELLAKRGFTYINTPYVIMLNKEHVKHGIFGFDSGLMTVDRGADLLNWDTIGAKPEGAITGSTCGMHWPNLLHEDPERNSEIVEGWVKFLAPYNDKQETLLAKHSDEFKHQLAHHVCTKTIFQGNLIELDFSETDKLPGSMGKNELTLKINSIDELQFSSKNIKIISSTLKRNDNSIVHTVCLDRIKGILKASVNMSPKL